MNTVKKENKWEKQWEHKQDNWDEQEAGSGCREKNSKTTKEIP